MAAKALRVTFATALQGKGDVHLPARLIKVFKEINRKGSGIRGQRPIALSTCRTMLEGLEFDEGLSFSSVFKAPIMVAPNAARDSSVITIKGLLPGISVSAPVGASHFRLLSALGIVSDYKYNPAAGHYEPVSSSLNMLSAVVYSEITSLTDTSGINLILTPNLSASATVTITEDVSVVQCLGIEFFQRVDSADYMLSQDNSLKIVKVF